MITSIRVEVGVLEKYLEWGRVVWELEAGRQVISISIVLETVRCEPRIQPRQ